MFWTCALENVAVLKMELKAMWQSRQEEATHKIWDYTCCRLGSQTSPKTLHKI